MLFIWPMRRRILQDLSVGAQEDGASESVRDEKDDGGDGGPNAGGSGPGGREPEEDDRYRR